jgi:hypothetical protein
MSAKSHHPHAAEIDRIAGMLIAAWAKAEPDHGVTKHPTSYVATFVDMARVIVEDAVATRDRKLDAMTKARDELAEIADQMRDAEDVSELDALHKRSFPPREVGR